MFSKNVALNREILRLLKEDGRLSYRVIADKMDMEWSTVRKRIYKLVERGIVKRFTIEVNSEEPVEEITAFITVFPFLRYSEEVKKRLIGFEEVLESHCLAGRCGVFLKASFHNVHDLNDFVEKIKSTQGVMGIRSCIVTDRLK